MAKRLCRLTPNGRIAFDYDMKIAEPFRLPGGEGGVDLWPALEAFADVPLLLLRGERSELLSRDTAMEMQRRLPHMADRKSTRLNSSHYSASRMPSSA